MEIFISVLGGICFTFSIYIIILLKLSHKKRIELLDWFLLSLATFNGVIFGFIIWATHSGKNSFIYGNLIMNLDWASVLFYLVLSIIFSIYVILGWNFIKKISNFYSSKKEIKLNINFREEYVLKKIISVAWIMFIIAIVTYRLYTNSYGGFYGLLTYSKMIRSGILIVENPFSFLQRFGGFSFFSSYIFFALLIDKGNMKIKRKSIFVGFIITTVFSLYVLYSWMGRVGLIIYIATFLLGKMLYNNKSIFKLIKNFLILFILLLFLLIFTDSLLGRSGNNIGIIELLTKELSFPLSSFYIVLNLDKYRWFTDIFVAPLYILPMRIWNGILNIETASSFNTLLTIGARKGENGVMGEIPIDMLSFSFMQGNILGVVIIAFIWGGILYILKELINRIPIESIKRIMEANIILNIGIKTVIYADPQHIITGNFYMIFGFVILWIFLKIKVKWK